MRTILKISIGLNVILAVTVMAIWVERQKDLACYAPKPKPPAIAAQQEPTVVTQFVQVSTPFRWSQLVSRNDYKAFVANLRASGCPEQTVEEIVYGDLNVVFDQMHRRLGIDGNTPGTWSDESQMKLAAYLLGQALPQEVAKTAPRPHKPESNLPLQTPLVMQDVDVKTLGLSDDQVQAIASVRQDFLNQTDGSDQDTNTPAFRQRWRRAQQAADNMLMADLGDEAFNKFEVMVYQTYLLKQQ